MSQRQERADARWGRRYPLCFRQTLCRRLHRGTRAGMARSLRADLRLPAAGARTAICLVRAWLRARFSMAVLVPLAIKSFRIRRTLFDDLAIVVGPIPRIIL